MKIDKIISLANQNVKLRFLGMERAIARKFKRAFQILLQD